MTEQELKDGEAYQASDEGTVAALVFELMRVTNALEAIANYSATVELLLPEKQSIAMSTRRLKRIDALLWIRETI